MGIRTMLGALARLRPRQRADEAHATREYDSLRLLAEQCGDVIFRFGPDGKARYISPSVERLFGYTPKEIYAMGGDIVSNGFVFDEDKAAIAGAVQQHFAGQLPEVKLEFRVVHRGGALIWVETNCSTILDPQTGRPSDIIFTMRDISEKKALETKLEALARSDGLTGLANRRAFDEVLDHEWRRTLRSGATLSLLILDVDHFKAYNDHSGHQVGDDCLRAVARAIGDKVRRAGDLAARYGGEEFAVILPGTSHADALTIAETIRGAIEALRLPHPGSSVGEYVTVSVGAATAKAAAGGTMDMPQGLLQAADTALYKAKSSGRNRVESALLLAPKASRSAA